MNSEETREYDKFCKDLEDYESFKQDFLRDVIFFLQDERDMPIPRIYIDSKHILQMKEYLEENFDDVFGDQKAVLKKIIEEYEARDSEEYKDQVRAEYYNQQMGD